MLLSRFKIASAPRNRESMLTFPALKTAAGASIIADCPGDSGSRPLQLVGVDQSPVPPPIQVDCAISVESVHKLAATKTATNEIVLIIFIFSFLKISFVLPGPVPRTFKCLTDAQALHASDKPVTQIRNFLAQTTGGIGTVLGTVLASGEENDICTQRH